MFGQPSPFYICDAPCALETPFEVWGSSDRMPRKETS